MSESTNEITDSANNSNGLIGLAFFIVITIIYFIIKITSKSDQSIKIWTFIYFLLVIVGEYFINLSTTNVLCGSAQYTTAIYVTIIPWVIIFGLLNLMIKMFPGWLSPFSNTFGYFAAKLAGIDKLIKEILVPKIPVNTPDDELRNEALGYMYSNPTLIVNKITETNFDSFWDKMATNGTSDLAPGVKFLKSNIEQYKEKFRGYIKLKDTVSVFIWYLLTGGLVTSVSYNYIVNAGCKQSASDIEKKHNEYTEQQEIISQEKTQPRVYNITD